MAKDDKHPIRNAIIGAVVGGLILTAILGALDFLPTAWSWLVSICRWIFGIASYSVTLPLCVVLFLASPWIYIVIRRYALIGKPWRKYTEDTIGGIVWRWKYGFGGEPTDLCPYCPLDDTLLVWSRPTIGQVEFHCDSCNARFGPFKGLDREDSDEAVKRQIDRKIRTGEWNRKSGLAKPYEQAPQSEESDGGASDSTT